MGFFDGIKKGMEVARQERLEKEELKAYIPPREKLYEPGHKNKSGPAKHNALINLLGISDLDEVIEQCAPEFTKAMYGIRDKVYEQDDYKSKYYELKGKTESLEQAYRELQKRESDLMKQQAELIELLKEKSNSNMPQR